MSSASKINVNTVIEINPVHLRLWLIHQYTCTMFTQKWVLEWGMLRGKQIGSLASRSLTSRFKNNAGNIGVSEQLCA